MASSRTSTGPRTRTCRSSDIHNKTAAAAGVAASWAPLADAAGGVEDQTVVDALAQHGAGIRQQPARRARCLLDGGDRHRRRFRLGAGVQRLADPPPHGQQWLVALPRVERVGAQGRPLIGVADQGELGIELAGGVVGHVV